MSSKNEINTKPSNKPRIMLMGDSIRMNYAPIVAKILENEAEIVHIVDENGEHTKKTKEKLVKWLKQVDGSTLSIIHFNNGVHDLSWNVKKKKSKVPISKYEKNLHKIIQIFREKTSAKLLWATLTPINTEKHKKTKPNFLVREDLHSQYNKIALKVMEEEGIPVNDIGSVIINEGIEKCMVEDGVHMNDHGYKLLANTVADFLRQYYITTPNVGR
jgi:lysophospholipase L1-like esterase